MPKFELKMPKLGESITEATITKWLKNVGDNIEMDAAILEIATDKVDSEIPSPVEGIMEQRFFNEGDVVAVETIIAIINTGQEQSTTQAASAPNTETPLVALPATTLLAQSSVETISVEPPKKSSHSGRFFSPLVRTIAKEENITIEELEQIPGSGHQNRLVRQDLIDYLKKREAGQAAPAAPATAAFANTVATTPKPAPQTPTVIAGTGDQIVEMSRMRKLIAGHMVMSEATSVHITLFAEADVTNIVNWRNRQKAILENREGEKLTFTPIFIDAIAKALRDYPMVNVSVDNDKIIVRKNVNIGMAAATPDGNLIVPVIKNADHKSLLGLTKEVNDLANRARASQLKPDEIQGGTFTLTNFGSFGAMAGTPIINQPQVAILGVGIIQKKPVVIETSQGDTIGIRNMMMLSLACDHRVVDGALGGMFLRQVAQYLENFDISQKI